jgi:hypothetical protein
MVAATGGLVKHYDRLVGTVDAGRSGCRIFDGAGVPHQLRISVLPGVRHAGAGVPSSSPTFIFL